MQRGENRQVSGRLRKLCGLPPVTLDGDERCICIYRINDGDWASDLVVPVLRQLTKLPHL